jgi:CheY-like chemotaxis protein
MWLSLCEVSQGIVARHAGELAVTSLGEGFGSTFSLLIPTTTVASPVVSIDAEHNPMETLSVSHLSSTPQLRSIPFSGRRRSTVNHLDNNLVRSFVSVVDLSDNVLSERGRAQIHPAPAPGLSPTPHRSVATRVLIVDDSEMNRKMVTRLLRRRCGYVEEAEDGLVAVEKVLRSMEDQLGSSNRFDVVLIDYEMPHLNGPEAVKRMRDLGYSGYIIGLTGHVGSSDIDVFMESGANHVLSKPFNAPEFDKLMTRRFPAETAARK